MDVNTLIWILYFADIVRMIKLVGLAVPACYIVIITINVLTGDKVGKTSKNLIIASCVVMVVALLIPSENAIYKMAGLKYGSDLVKNVSDSDRYKKIMKIIDSKIDKMVEESERKE